MSILILRIIDSKQFSHLHVNECGGENKILPIPPACLFLKEKTVGKLLISPQLKCRIFLVFN